MVDTKEEQNYKRLRKLGQELHIPIFEAFLELEVRDKEGKVIQRHRQRSHSWVRNAYNLMFCQLAAKDADDDTFEAGKLNIKDTGGLVRSGAYPLYIAHSATISVDVAGNRGYRALAGGDTYGILIGTGTGAESFEDFELGTQIADGTGVGELSHVESEAHSITWTVGTLTLKNELVRYFNNNSGGSIGVNEVGLAAYGAVGGSTAHKWLNARDKLGATVTIPDTGQLKVTYTISLVYPA